MRIFGRIVVAIVALGGVALSYAFSTRDPLALPIPPLGSYRIRSSGQEIRGNSTLLNPRGEVVTFDVDYQGPREFAEIVLENWDGPKLLSTESIARYKFGSATVTMDGPAYVHGEGAAFLQTSQRFTVWLDSLPESYPDGRNALARVCVWDPADLTVARTRKSLNHVVALEDRPRNQSSEPRPNLSETIPDSDSTLVWQRNLFDRDYVGGGRPPYPEGATVSRMLFRLVEK